MTSAAPLRPLFRFTRHAVTRTIERLDAAPLDDRGALTLLCNAAPRAELMTERTNLGHAVWSIADPPMRWITKPDRDREGRRVAIVVTVLGPGEVEAQEEAEREVIEAHRRIEEAPGVGRPEPTTPAPEPGAPWSSTWLALEVQRLAVERDRLRALIAARRTTGAETTRSMSPEEARARSLEARAKQAEHIAVQMAQKTERIRLNNDRHVGILKARRDELLAACAARLAEVDPVGSAELLARVAVFREPWRADEEASDG